MEQGNSSIRDRLLAYLPQPENLEAYREETASLLAKHERALFWEKMPAAVAYMVAIAIVMVNWAWGQKFHGAPHHFVWFYAGFAYFVGTVTDLRYRIYRSKVDMLKEVKQIQLQILEIQASIQKRGSE